MDEKTTTTTTNMMQHPHRSTRTIAALAILLLLGFFTYRQLQAGPVPSFASAVPSIADNDHSQAALAHDLVPLEAHIISKCPDTRVRQHTSLRIDAQISRLTESYRMPYGSSSYP